jgi:hypothetical protein
MKNEGGSALNGMYLGQFADFDMGADYSSNYAGTDAGRRLAYMYATASGPYVGIKLLDPTTAANLSVIDHEVYVYPGSEMSEQTKIDFLDGTLSFSQSNRAADWSIVVSAGPFDMAPGDSEAVAVAIIGGDDLSDLEDNADDAQAIYDQGPGVAEGISRRRESIAFALYENHPNPFATWTRIGFMLPGREHGSLTIYDTAGRAVRSYAVTGKGHRQSVLWDGTDAQGRQVSSGVYFTKLSWSGLSASRKLVVTR